MSSTLYTIILIAIAVIITVILRAIPFAIFRGGKTMPPKIKAVADLLPTAIIAVLVIYCIKDSLLAIGSTTAASIIAIAAVVLVHLWKRNTLLSIALGTVLYMILIRIL